MSSLGNDNQQPQDPNMPAGQSDMGGTAGDQPVTPPTMPGNMAGDQGSSTPEPAAPAPAAMPPEVKPAPPVAPVDPNQGQPDSGTTGGSAPTV